MKKIQELPVTKEIAPDLQAKWGDSKNQLTIDQTFAYIKSMALEKSINVQKTQNGYLVSQWNMAKHISSDDELHYLLRKMGVKA